MRSIHPFVFGLGLTLGGLCFAQNSQIPAQAGEGEYHAAVVAIGTPLFNQAMADAKSGAATTVNSPVVSSNASNSMSSAALGAIANDPKNLAYGKQLQTEQAGQVKAITADQIKQVQAGLPSIGSVQGFGQLVVATKDGPEVISLIRKAPTVDGKELNEILAKIRDFASKGNPEALNFMGWAFEYGAFGASIDMQKAVSYYSAAAEKNYVTARYNLATVSFWGKSGQAPNPRQAKEYADQAAIVQENSQRMCGLASFINYRLRNGSLASQFANGCASPLAGLAKATFNSSLDVNERIKLLEKSIGTGANDGFIELERLGKNDSKSLQFYFCKYSILNAHRFNLKGVDTLGEAKSCYLTSGTVPDLDTKEEKISRDLRIKGISSYVHSEVSLLESLRATTVVNFSISVPYLPFMQGDEEKFKKYLKPFQNPPKK